MQSPPPRDSLSALLTADELALFTKPEQQLLLALTRYLTPEELAILTVEDLEFCLSLEGMELPDIPIDEARRVVIVYRDYIRKKLTQ